ncbi:hypothetical protein [Methylobacterium variabile]|jgi:hypothetical protein|nr:hypothetical protein [Methylobacterium variabile]
MIKIFKKKSTERKQTSDETVISDAALSQAAGGLNPQPLPPRWGGRRGF